MTLPEAGTAGGFGEDQDGRLRDGVHLLEAGGRQIDADLHIPLDNQERADAADMAVDAGLLNICDVHRQRDQFRQFADPVERRARVLVRERH